MNSRPKIGRKWWRQKWYTRGNVEKQKEDQVGSRSSYQTTDNLATRRMIEQKCHDWGIKMWTATVDFTKTFDSITDKSICLKSCNIVASWRRYSESKSTFIDRQREQHFQDPKKEPSKVTHCPVCCPTRFFNTHRRTKSNDGKREEWEYSWATTTMIASLTWDSPTTCCCSQHPKNSYWKCCVTSRKVLKKWLRIHAEKTKKILSNRASIRTKKKEFQVEDMKIEILTRNEVPQSRIVSGQYGRHSANTDKN